MTEQRIGRQTPTQVVALPYSETRGQSAVDLYEKGKRTCWEWQKLLLFDIMAVDEEGLWKHPKFGYSVPRRNGKNEIVAIRELWGILNGENVMHTAHRTTTSHSAWERLCGMLERAGSNSGEGEQGPAGPKGDKGDKGDTGAKGDKGDTGDDGKSAYEQAVEGGYTDTEATFSTDLADISNKTTYSYVTQKISESATSVIDTAEEYTRTLLNNYTESTDFETYKQTI